MPISLLLTYFCSLAHACRCCSYYWHYGKEIFKDSYPRLRLPLQDLVFGYVLNSLNSTQDLTCIFQRGGPVVHYVSRFTYFRIIHPCKSISLPGNSLCWSVNSKPGEDKLYYRTSLRCHHNISNSLRILRSPFVVRIATQRPCSCRSTPRASEMPPVILNRTSWCSELFIVEFFVFAFIKAQNTWFRKVIEDSAL